MKTVLSIYSNNHSILPKLESGQVYTIGLCYRPPLFIAEKLQLISAYMFWFLLTLSLNVTTFSVNNVWKRSKVTVKRSKGVSQIFYWGLNALIIQLKESSFLQVLLMNLSVWLIIFNEYVTFPNKGIFIFFVVLHLYLCGHICYLQYQECLHFVTHSAQRELGLMLLGMLDKETCDDRWHK